MGSFFRSPLPFNKEGSMKLVRVAVVSASRGSGASFISGLTAELLSSMCSVSLFETCGSYFYEALALGSRLAFSGFTDYFSLIKAKERITKLGNTVGGINFIVRRPEMKEPLSSGELFRLLSLASSTYNIFDCSEMNEQDMLDFTASCDKLIFVVDPLPTKMIQKENLIERIRLLYPDSLFVINKMNSGVHRKELEKFIGTKDYLPIPALDADVLYKIQYNAAPFLSYPGILKKLGNPQDVLTKYLT